MGMGKFNNFNFFLQFCQILKIPNFCEQFQSLNSFLPWIVSIAVLFIGNNFFTYISTFAKAQKNLVFVKLVGAIDNNLLDVDRKKRPQNFWPISNKNGHFDKGELL